jgi:hypothetical protein
LRGENQSPETTEILRQAQDDNLGLRSELTELD